jgi:hypothetical protein
MCVVIPARNWVTMLGEPPSGGTDGVCCGTLVGSPLWLRL